MVEFRKNIKGRGASSQPANRFNSLNVELDPQDWDNYLEEEKPLLRTQFLRDASKTIVTENKSPDVGFTFSVNPYRGCEHGCAYCYARPTHEYLGYSAGLDFESKIFVKEKAPELLREKLMSKSWKADTVAMSGVTDCYQPIERKLQLTRKCLQVLLDFKNPAALITKNHLVTRDLDLFKQFAEWNGILVFISITTLDADLCGVLEPRTSRPASRLEAIRCLAENNIPVGVNVAPVIPGLTDHELPGILKAAAEAGAKHAGYVPIRLPLTVSPIFEEWLTVHRPERKERVLSAIRDMRGGKLNDAQFESRMRGEGPIAANIAQMYKIYSHKFGLNQQDVVLDNSHFSRPGDQLGFF
jgi:DNA repair photolyase